MKHIGKILIPILLFAESAQAAKLGGTVRGTVLELSERPPVSGLIQTWVEILIVDKDRRAPVKLLIPNMEEGQIFPKVGATCTFIFHFENISGSVGPQIQKKKNAKVVDNFSCSEDK